MMLLYTAIRYGVSDRVTHLVLAFAGMITAVVYAWGQPIALAICIVLGLCVLTASAIGREYRRAAMVLPNATHMIRRRHCFLCKPKVEGEIQFVNKLFDIAA